MDSVLDSILEELDSTDDDEIVTEDVKGLLKKESVKEILLKPNISAKKRQLTYDDILNRGYSKPDLSKLGDKQNALEAIKKQKKLDIEKKKKEDDKKYEERIKYAANYVASWRPMSREDELKLAQVNINRKSTTNHIKNKQSSDSTSDSSESGSSTFRLTGAVGVPQTWFTNSKVGKPHRPKELSEIETPETERMKEPRMRNGRREKDLSESYKLLGMYKKRKKGEKDYISDMLYNDLSKCAS